MRRICCIALLIGWFWPLPAHAQPDTQLWTEAGFRLPLQNKLELRLDQHLRFADSASEVHRSLTDLGLSYGVRKWFEVGGGYRLILRPSAASACCRHRGHVDLALRERLGPVKVGLRLRGQSTLRGSKSTRHVLRARLRLKLATLRVVRPYVDVESFSRLADEQALQSRTLRWGGGVDVVPLQPWRVRAYVLRETPLVDAADSLLILGLATHWSW